MQSIADVMHETLRRIAEPAPLGLDDAKALARVILDAVSDPKLHPSIAMKAARAIVDGKLDAGELTPALDRLIADRRLGFIKSRGAYFVACLKRAFQLNEIPW